MLIPNIIHLIGKRTLKTTYWTIHSTSMKASKLSFPTSPFYLFSARWFPNTSLFSSCFLCESSLYLCHPTETVCRTVVLQSFPMKFVLSFSFTCDRTWNVLLILIFFFFLTLFLFSSFKKKQDLGDN